MATRQPRAPRTPKAKTEQPKVEAKVEVKTEVKTEVKAEVEAKIEQEQPVEVKVETEQPKVEPEPVEGEKTEAKTPKAKKLVFAGITAPRIRRHIDRLGINAAIELELVKYRKQLNDLKSALALVTDKKVTESVTVEVDGKNKTEQRTRDATADEIAAAEKVVAELSLTKADNEMHAVALSRERTRFSSEAAPVLSFVAEEMIDSLIEHAMDAAIAEKKVTIQVAHLHSAGVEKLPLYPLFKSLPKFASTAAKFAKEASDAHMAAVVENAVAAAEKALRAQYASFLPKEQKVAKVKQAKPEIVTETEDTTDNKVSFKFYVVHASDKLKASEKYAGKNIKISNDIKTYLSDLVIEFLERVSNLAMLTVASMKNSTVNDSAIMRTIEQLLIDGHKSVDAIAFSIEDIKDPAFIKAEADKRKQNPAYKVNTEVPLVKGLIADKTTTYPTSYYSVLAASVADKLAEYKKKPPVEEADEEEAEVV